MCLWSRNSKTDFLVFLGKDVVTTQAVLAL